MRKTSWRVRGGESKVFSSDDREVYVVLVFSWSSANTGVAFVKNHNSGFICIELFIERSGEKEYIVNEKVGSAYTTADASKVAHAYIRENGLRKQLKEVAEKIIGDYEKELVRV